MTAIGIRVRSELRRRRSSAVVLVVLIAIFGGVVLTSAAAARRTDSAFDRLRAQTRAADAIVSAEGHGRSNGFYRQVAAFEELTSSAVVVGMNAEARAGGESFGAPTLVALDDRYMSAVDRPKLVEGRMPRRDRRDEALVNRALAKQASLHAGSRLTVTLQPVMFPPPPRPVAPKTVRVTVTGVALFASEVVPVSPFDSQPELLLGAEFARGNEDYVGFDALYVRLRPGTNEDALRAKIEAAAAASPGTGGIFFSGKSDPNAQVRRAIRPEAVALALFALLLGLTFLLAVGRSIGYRTTIAADDFPSLRACGMSPRQLVVTSFLESGILSAAGCVGAVVIAAIASPLGPIGKARLAEPNPGFTLDAVALGFGSVALFASLTLLGAIPSLRRSTTVTGRDVRRPSRVAGLAARAPLSVSAPAGLRLALEGGRGSAAVPVRSTIAGVVFALAAVSMTISFGQSLHRLTRSPPSFGENWNVTIDGQFNTIENAGSVIGRDPAVDAYAGAVAADVTINGKRVPAIAIDDVSGEGLIPRIVEGHAPRSREEIALGTKTLERLHLRTGDVVTVRLGADERRLRVVARAVFPSIGLGVFSPTGLGEGALLTYDALQPDDGAKERYGLVFIRVSEEEKAGFIERMREAVQGPLGASCAEACLVRDEVTPGDIKHYATVEGTPDKFAGLLAILAAAVLAHVLVVSIRRRQKDLAVLKTLGFARAQVRSAVAWQASAIAALAAVIGIPLGVVVGRWAWIAFADELGVPTSPYVPVALVAFCGLAAILFANVIAAVPARLAARVRPARVLHVE